MRRYQERGLTPEAEYFLEQNCIKITDRSCPRCGEVISYKYKELEYKRVDLFMEMVQFFTYMN